MPRVTPQNDTQSRTPIERLEAMQELSFAFFQERGNEAEVRRQFLRSPRIMRISEHE
jgi:hypothetical protein